MHPFKHIEVFGKEIQLRDLAKFLCESEVVL